MIQKTISLQNTQVHYSTMGSGQPVVLLHGFAEDSNIWKHQLDVLSKNNQLIIPDLPGSGKSGMLKDMSMESMADCIKKILDQELIETQPVAKDYSAASAIIIGHSMGGYITLAFAEKYPDIVQGLGLFHSSAFADSAEKKAARLRGIEFIQTHGSAAFIRQSTPNLFTEDYRTANDVVVAEMMTRYSTFDPRALIAYYQAMIERPDSTAVLQSFNKPVLFIIGKQDKAVPFEDSMKQCHLPQLASIQILEKTAHMGMWEEQEKSSQALLLFLEYVQQFTLHATSE